VFRNELYTAVVCPAASVGVMFRGTKVGIDLQTVSRKTLFEVNSP